MESNSKDGYGKGKGVFKLVNIALCNGRMIPKFSICGHEGGANKVTKLYQDQLCN